jgi:hypothetical protein
VTNPAGFAQADLSISKPPVRCARVLANAALFLVACAAICALLRSLAPFPAVPGIFPKWEWFKARRDQVEVLFIGSSRFFHQVIPPQFDAQVARAGGASVQSFNFGYDGMWPPESYYFLRQILTLRPARLRWVFIELKDIDTQLDERNNSTLRMAYWHDARHTRLAFADILSSRRHWPEKRALLAAHGWLFLREAANVGRGAELLSRRLAPAATRKFPRSWEDHAGYEAEQEQTLRSEIEEDFRARVARMKKLGPPEPVRAVFHDALREIIADVRSAGAEPIFVIAPTVNPNENYGGIPDGAAAWTFNNPDAFPTLYDPAHHYDEWHLNPQGAIEFTALLAARFAEFTRKER